MTTVKALFELVLEPYSRPILLIITTKIERFDCQRLSRYRKIADSSVLVNLLPLISVSSGS